MSNATIDQEQIINYIYIQNKALFDLSYCYKMNTFERWNVDLSSLIDWLISHMLMYVFGKD